MKKKKIWEWKKRNKKHMDPALQNYISMLSALSKQLLGLYGTMTKANVLGYGAPNLLGEITQEMIDSIPTFANSGLTVARLGDAAYVLEQIRLLIDGGLPALAVLDNTP